VASPARDCKRHRMGHVKRLGTYRGESIQIVLLITIVVGLFSRWRLGTWYLVIVGR
jgi:hypothetical protein